MNKKQEEQNKKGTKLDWTDFQKLTENQLAALQAYKNVQDRKKSMEQDRKEE